MYGFTLCVICGILLPSVVAIDVLSLSKYTWDVRNTENSKWMNDLPLYVPSNAYIYLMGRRMASLLRISFTSNFDAFSGIHQKATVPGGIFSDLQRAGVLNESIYYRFNDVGYRWVAREDWTYSVDFAGKCK